MEKLHRYTDIGFLLALLATPFLPDFGRVEITGPQYLYLSGVLFFYMTIKLIFKQKLGFILNYSTTFYLLFLITALLSIFNAFNVIASVIEITKYFISFLILVFTFSIFNNNRTHINSALIAILGFLFIETSYILYIFIENYSFDNPPIRMREFQGLAYNQNIASLSILAKIPIVLFFLMKNKTKKIKYFLVFLLALAVFDILIIGSRSAIYGVFLLLIYLLSLIAFIKHFNFIDINRKNLFKPILIIISVFILQNVLYTNSKQNLQALERVSILNDNSTNYRINFWESSFEMIKDFPFLGVGIGNWKILSIKYGKNYLRDYEIPKHAHNDFLQIFSETGILGGSFFLLFLISPFYFLLKNYFSFSPREKELSIFLTFSLIAIGIDSFFNFPRVRPYSLLNLFWVISLIYNLKAKKITEINKSSRTLLFIGGLILMIPSIYIFQRVNNSMKEQVPLYIEFNQYPDTIITPVNEILLFEDEFPNISNVVIPMKMAKARYLFMEGKYDEAKRLIKEGQKHNPFLGFGDFLLMRIYLAEKKLDSAVYYGKRSIDKLPNNETHISFYQITQEKVKDLEEIERIFLNSLKLKSETIWQNYLISIAYIKQIKEIDYTDNERKYLEQALELYPDNTILKSADKIINYGGSIIIIANEFDSQAFNYFSKKDYQKAIDNWKKAIDVISDDEAYYLNIAQAYLVTGKTEEAEKYLNLIEIKNLKSNSGKFEILKAMLYLKLKRIRIACSYAKTAKDLGNADAQLILNQLNCSVNQL